MLVFSSLLLGATAPANTLQFVRLPTEQGISIGSVESIYQDNQGYMWFGGLDGLVQFDGYNFINHRHRYGDERTLSSNVVWDIFQDRQGQLWIATDGGLNRYDYAQGHFSHIQHDPDNPASLCSNFTRKIAEDSQGVMWIATFGGLTRFDQQHDSISCHQHEPNNPASLASNELRTLYIDSEDSIWIGTNHSGLNRMDIGSGQFQRYPYDLPGSKHGSSHGTVASVFQDQDGFIWLGTEGGGLNRFDPKTEQFLHIPFAGRHGLWPAKKSAIGPDPVLDIVANSAGDLWLATDIGLALLDRQSLQFQYYRHNPGQQSSIISNVVRSLYLDTNQDLWVGNFPGGVNFLDASSQAFRTWRHDPTNSNSLSHPSVLAIAEDKQGNLWLGTDGGGLNYFNRQTGQFTHYQPDPDDPDALSSSVILSIEPLADGSLWLGAWGGGAIHYDPTTAKVLKAYLPDPQNPHAISSANIWTIRQDQQQRLWLSTLGGGLTRYIPAIDGFETYDRQFPEQAPVSVVWTTYQDHLGQIWSATSEGLGRYLPEQNHFVFSRFDPNDPDSLSFNVVLDIAEDKQQRLWVATRGGGLNRLDPVTGAFSRIGEEQGLPSNVINFLLPDDQGYFWLGSNAGLTRFDPFTHEVIHYTKQNGLQGNQFNIGAAIQTRSGDIVIGGTEGFTIFNPAEVQPNQHIPPVAIVDFHIFNKPVVAGAPGSPLSQVISHTDHITLDYHQSVFSFFFTAMSYRDPTKNRFAYKLEGFERNWNFVDSSRRNATYTNLNPGTYVFQVKAANNHGVWNEEVRRITLHILPPPWKTWWAYSLYGLSALGLLLLFVMRQHRKVSHAQQISRDLEVKVKERTAELKSKHEQLEEAYTQLEAISLSDPLTGLSNRRYLQRVLPMDIAKIQREFGNQVNEGPDQKPCLDLTFFLLDLDYFKSVNDTYGHLAGDQILIQFSELLHKLCRESDCLVRWGGEEFLIVSRFTSRTEAPFMAERIRLGVAQHPFTLPDGSQLSKTCSIGFACFPFHHGKPMELSWEQVIDTADRALYAAKKSGRNRCVGLAATATTPSDKLYQRICENIQGMIAGDELEVIAQKSDHLMWD